MNYNHSTPVNGDIHVCVNSNVHNVSYIDIDCNVSADSQSNYYLCNMDNFIELIKHCKKWQKRKKKFNSLGNLQEYIECAKTLPEEVILIFQLSIDTSHYLNSNPTYLMKLLFLNNLLFKISLKLLLVLPPLPRKKQASFLNTSLARWQNDICILQVQTNL